MVIEAELFVREAELFEEVDSKWPIEFAKPPVGENQSLLRCGRGRRGSSFKLHQANSEAPYCPGEQSEEY